MLVLLTETGRRLLLTVSGGKMGVVTEGVHFAFFFS